MDEYFRYIWGVVLTLLGVVWAMLNTRIGRGEAEMDRQRNNIATLFDKLEAHNAEDRDRFEKLVEKINTSHLKLVDEIRKVDHGRRS